MRHRPCLPGHGLRQRSLLLPVWVRLPRLPIYRIYTQTVRENLRARALTETLGMCLEGVLKQTRYFKNRWWDTAVYAVLKDEWEA